MEGLIKSKGSCNLRRININSWKSAVAKQYGIRSLPSLWLFDGESAVSKDGRDVLRRVQELH